MTLKNVLNSMSGIALKLNKYIHSIKKVYFLCCLIIVGAVNFIFGSGINDKDTKEHNDTIIFELYSQAQAYFEEANNKSISREKTISLYEKSAMRYERLIKEYGIKNGEIYYNLGNIYFRMNDIGRAILNYLKSEQYMPNDNNLRQNLSYAREKRIDEIEEKQGMKILKTIFFWHFTLPVKTRIMLFSFFFALVWIIAGFRIFYKKSFLTGGIVFFAFFSLLVSGSLVAEEITLKKVMNGVIISFETTARKGNSEKYEPSFKKPLHAGTEFVLMEGRGDWYYVKLADSRTCWISSRDVELISSTSLSRLKGDRTFPSLQK